MAVHAICDLKQGEEATLSYINPLTVYSERKERLQKAWNFDCKCRLCEVEGKDGNCSKRFRLLQQFIDFARTDSPAQVVQKGKSVLKQVNFAISKIRHNNFMYLF